MNLNCPICKSTSTFNFASNYVDVYRCTNNDCDHLFAGNVQPYSGVHDYEKEMEVDFTMYKERNEALIKYFFKAGFLKKNSKVLDFGTGTGHILHSLKMNKDQINITAVEFNEKYHAKLNDMGVKVIKELNNLNDDEKFDAILIIEVIEHLDDPVKTLSTLQRKLQTHGKLFVSTPAGDLRLGYPNIQELSAYESPFHIQFFTEKSLLKCLKLAGFSKPTYKYIDSFYPGRSRQKWDVIKRTIKMYYAFFRSGVGHLTYFARK